MDEINTPSPSSSRGSLLRTPCFTQDSEDAHYMPDDNPPSDEDSSFCDDLSQEATTTTSKRVFFTWEKTEMAGSVEEKREELKKTYKYKYTLRGNAGYVYACSLHDGCSHKMKILSSGDVFECGEHTETLGSPPAVGIHPRFKDLVDHQLLAGLKPAKILAHCRELCSGQDYLLPTRQQISNRRLYVLRPEVRVDSVNALRDILSKKKVRNFPCFV